MKPKINTLAIILGLCLTIGHVKTAFAQSGGVAGGGGKGVVCRNSDGSIKRYFGKLWMVENGNIAA